MENNFFIWRECVKKWAFSDVELSRYAIVGRMLFLWFIFKRTDWESFIHATEAFGRIERHTGITSLEVLLCARNCWCVVHLLSHYVTWWASLRPFFSVDWLWNGALRAPAGPAGFLHSWSCRGGSLQRAERAAAVGGRLAETLVLRVLAARSYLWFLTSFARWQYLARSGDIFSCYNWKEGATGTNG